MYMRIAHRLDVNSTNLARPKWQTVPAIGATLVGCQACTLQERDFPASKVLAAWTVIGLVVY